MNRLRGYLLIGGAAVLWGSSVALARAAFTGRLPYFAATLDPLALTQARITISALLMLPLALATCRGRLRLSARDTISAVALGVAGMSASNYFYYVAVQRTNIVTAILVEYTAPVWVLAYLVGRGRQRGTPARWAGVCLAMAGIALLLGLGSPGAGLRLDPVGAGFALLAAFAYAFYNVAGAGLSARIDPKVTALYMLVGAALFFACLHAPWTMFAEARAAHQLGFLFSFALWATLAPTLLYISGLQYLDPTRAVVTAGLEPVTGIVLSSVWLGEGLGWEQAAGAALVFAAIGIIQFGREEASPRIAQSDPFQG